MRIPETKKPDSFAIGPSGIQIAALAEFIGEPDDFPAPAS
jgi:hypothetical protein